MPSSASCTMQPFIEKNAVKTDMDANAISQPVYRVLHELSLKASCKLQMVQNAMAYVFTSQTHNCHIIALLWKMYWLSVNLQMQFKAETGYSG